MQKLITRPRSLWSADAVCVSALILAVMLGGEYLVAHAPAGWPRLFRMAWRLLDSPVHALQALLVVSPLLLWRQPLAESLRRMIWVGALAVLLDLDHFAAAGSFSLARALHLWSRPATHSILFAAIFGLGAGLVSRRPVYGWLAFAALAAHILYDAPGGSTPLFWPIPSDILAAPIAYTGVLALYFGSRALAVRNLTPPPLS
jgi:hypothetical protein